MDVKEALTKRYSVRAYLPKAVEPEKLMRILDAARHAPSGVNMQPWQVVVLQGDAKRRLDKSVEQAYLENIVEEPDYHYYPEKWVEPFKGRRMATGKQMYDALEVKREDKERRKTLWAANYRAFDAPAVLYFLLHESLGEGGFLDYGMFLQSIMLAAVEEGLGSCAQGALAEYPSIVKKAIGYEGKPYRLIGGMALGYPDPDAPINRYRTPREAVESFTTFIQ